MLDSNQNTPNAGFSIGFNTNQRSGISGSGTPGTGTDASGTRNTNIPGTSGPSGTTSGGLFCAKPASTGFGSTTAFGTNTNTTPHDLDHFPTPDEGPEFYVDYGETGPYVAEVGDGECAT